MEKVDLTFFDMKPEAMVNYLRYNGPHFSENLAKFAIDKMKKNGKKLDPVSLEQLTQFLKNANVKVDNDLLFDAWYVINMAKADYYGSSITSDAHLAINLLKIIWMMKMGMMELLLTDLLQIVPEKAL